MDCGKHEPLEYKTRARNEILAQNGQSCPQSALSVVLARARVALSANREKIIKASSRILEFAFVSASARFATILVFFCHGDGGNCLSNKRMAHLKTCGNIVFTPTRLNDFARLNLTGICRLCLLDFPILQMHVFTPLNTYSFIEYSVSYKLLLHEVQIIKNLYILTYSYKLR